MYFVDKSFYEYVFWQNQVNNPEKKQYCRRLWINLTHLGFIFNQSKLLIQKRFSTNTNCRYTNTHTKKEPPIFITAKEPMRIDVTCNDIYLLNHHHILPWKFQSQAFTLQVQRKQCKKIIYLHALSLLNTCSKNK